MSGFGEAMLIGAATGAGTSALTGNDPLKGALLGAVGGAAGQGLGGLLGGEKAATLATTGNAGASGVSGAGLNAANTAALNQANTVIGTSSGKLTSYLPTTVGNTVAPAGGITTTTIPAFTPTTQTGPLLAGASAGDVGILGNVGGEVAGATSVAGGVPVKGLTDVFLPKGDQLKDIGFQQRLGNYIVQNPQSAAMTFGGLSNTLLNRPSSSVDEGSLYNPLARISKRYRPLTPSTVYAAEGGLASLSSGDIVVGDPAFRVNMAQGGLSNLGSYSDGGRLLKGPGDGMSDNIPARIGNRQPARLADGEFVVPADVVSHLGNGSTDAGAKQLYAMMDKVRRARTGRKQQGRQIKPGKYMPA